MYFRDVCYKIESLLKKRPDVYDVYSCSETYDKHGNRLIAVRAAYDIGDFAYRLKRDSDIRFFEDEAYEFYDVFTKYDADEELQNYHMNNDEVAVLLKQKPIPRPERKGCRTMRLYHGTPEDRLTCILDKGLKSPCNPEVQKHPKGWKQERDLIWFTDNLNLAAVHATYYNDRGYIIDADVEVCNPLPWHRMVGDEIANEINSKRKDAPCEYARERGWTDPTDSGKETIVKMAERCEDVWAGMGETAEFFGFDSFHEVVEPEHLYGEGADNWAVTDRANVKMRAIIPVTRREDGKVEIGESIPLD